MNRIKLLLSTALLIGSSIIFAQKKQEFEGIIKFKIEYTEMDEALAAYASMMPKDIIVKVKGDYSKMEQNMGMAGSTSVITNQKTKQLTTLMEVMGSKYKMIAPITDKSQSNEATDYTIVYLNETKEIAGYTCKKAEIHSKTSDEILTIFYTEELSPEYLPNKPKEYDELKGFPMEYEVAQESMRMNISVSEIKKEKIPQSEFEIPSEYREVSQEELMKMYGGGK
jgi:GLPGLI family protein